MDQPVRPASTPKDDDLATNRTAHAGLPAVFDRGGVARLRGQPACRARLRGEVLYGRTHGVVIADGGADVGTLTKLFAQAIANHRHFGRDTSGVPA